MNELTVLYAYKIIMEDCYDVHFLNLHPSWCIRFRLSHDIQFYCILFESIFSERGKPFRCAKNVQCPESNRNRSIWGNTWKHDGALKQFH